MFCCIRYNAAVVTCMYMYVCIYVTCSYITACVFFQCFLNEEGECLRSREVFCQDGLTGAPLSDELCAARRSKPSTTLRCGARFCQ